MNELLELAVRIAKSAGELLMDRPLKLDIDTKGSDTDIVTQMDKASEKLIVDAILSARPDDGIIGEEGSERTSRSGYTWVIDPIDGTVNYLYDMAGWSVSIAIKDQKDQNGAVVGVVYSPTTNSLFTAVRGEGSFLNGVRLSCNDPIDLNRALIATGFAYRNEERKIQVAQFNKLILQIRDYRRNGSAAVDICHVASGKVDGYYEIGLHEWDLAAAALIAREAGARVMEFGNLVIAAGPHLFAQLESVLLSD